MNAHRVLYRVLSVFRLLFWPAIAVMNRLSYARKFVLISLLLSGPLAALVYLLLSSATERIEFGQRERVGIAYIQSVGEMLHAVERRRVLAVAVASGERSLADTLAQATQEVDDTMALVQSADALHGSTLQTHQEVSALVAQWDQVKKNTTTAEAVDREHADLSSAVVRLIGKHVGNHSNLLLDPDLNSYWLMDAYVIKVPELTETVARVCTASLALPKADPDRSSTLVDLAARIHIAEQTAHDLARFNLQFAAQSPRDGRISNIRQRLEAPATASIQAVTSQTRLVRSHVIPSVLHAGVAPVSTDRLVLQTLDVLRTLHELHRLVGPELDQLIQARIDGHQAHRQQGLGAAVATALLLTYLFIGFYLSVRASVLVLRRDPNTAPWGFVESLRPPSADELGQIAVAYTRAEGEKVRLQQALAHADRLATVGQLAAGTAHELNEPIGAILGFAQLAHKCPGLPEQAQQDLSKIIKASLHAREVIRKLVLFARRSPMQKVPMHLNKVVQEGLDMLSLRAESSRVNIACGLASGLSQIQADPSQVRQVVINLVVNAIQATPTSGQVTVTTSPGEDHVALIVADSGEGMSEDALKNIFLPFYTTKDVGKGTGLGLCVVHGIVTTHGGTIHVDSVPGQGTRIEVRWPIGE